MAAVGLAPLANQALTTGISGSRHYQGNWALVASVEWTENSALIVVNINFLVRTYYPLLDLEVEALKKDLFLMLKF